MQNQDKKKFIRNEILTLTINGGLGRCKTYKPNINPKQKKHFNIFLRNRLEYYGKYYYKTISNDQHIKNITLLTKEISNNFHRILYNDKFRIGCAQKLLNLYLKYLWSLSIIPEPPHCPIDEKIIRKIGLNISWTKIDRIDEYRKIIDKIKNVAKEKNLSIAKWELKEWRNE